MCVSAFSQLKGFMHKKTKKKRRTERQKVKKKKQHECLYSHAL